MAIPSSADFDRSGLDTEAPSFRIDEARPDDHGEGVAGAHDLSHALRPALEQPKSEPVTERGREGDRGDVTLIVLGTGLGILGQEMAAAAEAAFRFDRLESDQSGTLWIGESRARRHEAADEVLLGRKHLAHAEIVRRGLAVQLPARRVPLLDAEHAKRFSA